MYNIELGKSGLSVPAIAVGCMRMNSLTVQQANSFINTAIEHGADFFDHADIYAGGECEKIFAEAVEMTPSIREKIAIQTKCGIVPHKMYNFSKEYILSCVDKSLARLKTEYVDVLLLHRPDALCEPDEVGEAFELLSSAGKVRNFGVSNHNVMQLELLQKYLKMPLAVNQLRFGVMHCPSVRSGINVNMCNEFAADRDGGILDYCRLKDITIQAWSPFQAGEKDKKCFIDNPDYPEINNKLREIGNCYGVSNTTIAMAWVLRHPAKIQPVTGTMNEAHLKECLAAADITLTREEWYDIYCAAGNNLP